MKNYNPDIRKPVTGLIFERGQDAEHVRATLERDLSVTLVQAGHAVCLALPQYAELVPAWAAECFEVACGDRRGVTLGPVGLVLARRHAERSGLGIGRPAAHQLHQVLGDLGVANHVDYAQLILGRPVLSLACISLREAAKLEQFAAYRELVEGAQPLRVAAA